MHAYMHDLGRRLSGSILNSAMAGMVQDSGTLGTAEENLLLNTESSKHLRSTSEQTKTFNDTLDCRCSSRNPKPVEAQSHQSHSSHSKN